MYTYDCGGTTVSLLPFICHGRRKSLIPHFQKPEANAQRWAAQNGVLAVNLNWFFDSIEKEGNTLQYPTLTVFNGLLAVCMNEEDYHPEVPQGPVLRQVSPYPCNPLVTAVTNLGFGSGSRN